MLQRSTPARRPTLPLLATALCLASLAPFLFVSMPALQDYPAHIVRMYLLTDLQNDPILQTMYEIHWEVIPNLVMDLVVPPLSLIMPLFLAGKVFVWATVLMWILGPLALHHAIFGRLSYWPMAAAFFLMNQSFLFGFLNFCFGAGVLFFVLAAWIRLARAPPALRVALFSILATVLFFCHFIAFAIYAIVVLVHEAVAILEDKPFKNLTGALGRAFIAGAQFVLPALLFLVFSPTREELVPTEGIYFGGLESRIAAIRSTIWFENGVFDYLAFAFVACLFIGAAVSGRLQISRPFAVSLGVLFVAGMLTPQGLDGPGLRHVRIPAVLGALLFACSRWEPGPGVRRAPLILALGLAIFLARAANTTVRFHGFDAMLGEFRESLADVEPGAAMFLVTAGPTRHHFRALGGGAFLHMTDYATIDRSAFVSTVFADPGVQPVHQAEGYAARFGRLSFPEAQWEALPELAAAEPPDPKSYEGWHEKYDYVVVLNLYGLELDPLPCLTLHHKGGFFSIFEISGGGPAMCQPTG